MIMARWDKSSNWLVTGTFSENGGGYGASGGVYGYNFYNNDDGTEYVFALST
jgi:hypothetical protein